jgi:hypothetical protein
MIETVFYGTWAKATDAQRRIWNTGLDAVPTPVPAAVDRLYEACKPVAEAFNLGSSNARTE